MPILSTAQSNLIITYVALFAAYLTSIGLAGGTQAWCAKAFGDDTPEDAGFLTFNPIYHIHLFGVIMLLLLGIGLGPIQPIDASRLSPKWKELKLLLIYMSKAVVNLITATLSLVAMLAIFGNIGPADASMKKIFYLIKLCFTSGDTPLLAFSDVPHEFLQSFSETSTIVVVCGILLLALVFSNIFAAPFNCVVNGSYCALSIGLERQSQYVQYFQYFLIFGPFIVLYLFADTLLSIFLKATIISATLIASLLGLG